MGLDVAFAHQLDLVDEVGSENEQGGMLVVHALQGFSELFVGRK